MKHTHTHSHGEKILLDQIAYASRLRYVSPFLKLFVAIYHLVLCLIAKTYLVSVLILMLMLFTMTAIGKTRWHHVIRLMRIPLAFLILGCIMLLIQVTNLPQEMLCSVSLDTWQIGVTMDSLHQFCRVFLQCLAAVSCLYFLSTTTPMTELFHTLRRMHIPSFLVEIMELVYRYIFVLLEIASQMRHAQECRLGYATLKAGFYSTGQLISNLFLRAYRQAERTYMAMESRCYTGEVKTLGIAYQTKWWHIAVAVAEMIGLTIFAVLWKIA